MQNSLKEFRSYLSDWMWSD